MLRNEDVYHHIAKPYELLVSKEDYERNLEKAIADIADWQGKDIVDLGAGTGRLTCLFAPAARSVTAVDMAADMLKEAARKLTEAQLANWRAVVADYRNLPLEDGCADIVAAGWSICYIASSIRDNWREDLKQTMREIDRVTRDGGVEIIMETLGTGVEEPSGPDYLQPYYRALAEEYGFRHRAIRTDYRFDSPEQAETLCRNFFGDELGDRIREERLTIVPECTGIWWRRKGNSAV